MEIYLSRQTLAIQTEMEKPAEILFRIAEIIIMEPGRQVDQYAILPRKNMITKAGGLLLPPALSSKKVFLISFFFRD